MSTARRFADTSTPGLTHQFEARRVLVHERTAHQELVLFEHATFGTVLLLDGAVQLTTADEHVYHETMAHVPLLAHGAVRDVLIVGGGDGGLAARVLAHHDVRSVTLVEIDAAVVAFAKKHFAPMNKAAFADPRLAVVIEDATRFVAATTALFDAVLVDSTDPVGPARTLFERPFYAEVARCLRPGGVVVTQAGVPFVQADDFSSAMANLGAIFADATACLCTVPSYFGGQMALGFAGIEPCPTLEVLERRFAAAGLVTRSYTPGGHLAAFALPPWVEALLNRSGRGCA